MSCESGVVVSEVPQEASRAPLIPKGPNKEAAQRREGWQSVEEGRSMWTCCLPGLRLGAGTRGEGVQGTEA